MFEGVPGKEAQQSRKWAMDRVNEPARHLRRGARRALAHTQLRLDWFIERRIRGEMYPQWRNS